MGRKKLGKGMSRRLAAKTRGKGSNRMTEPPLRFVRSFPLQDISIRAGSDGRTVDAYATVFDTPVPIHDQDGDYIEVIDSRAFARILPKIAPQADRQAWRVCVFFNPRKTPHRAPAGLHSIAQGGP